MGGALLSLLANLHLCAYTHATRLICQNLSSSIHGDVLILEAWNLGRKAPIDLYILHVDQVSTHSRLLLFKEVQVSSEDLYLTWFPET